MNPIHCGQVSHIAEVAEEVLLVVMVVLHIMVMMAETEGQTAVLELCLKRALHLRWVMEEAVANMAALKGVQHDSTHRQKEAVLHIMVLVAAVVLNTPMNIKST